MEVGHCPTMTEMNFLMTKVCHWVMDWVMDCLGDGLSGDDESLLMSDSEAALCRLY